LTAIHDFHILDYSHMPEREPFNELAAEHILKASASDIHHDRHGDGSRLATPSGRNLDVFDGAVGINGRGMVLLFDSQDLTPVFTPDSVGFEGTVSGLPFSMTFRGDTGEVVFTNSAPPAADKDTGQASEELEQGKEVSFTGRLYRAPRVSTRGDLPQVKLSVTEHRPGEDGRRKTIWHDVWPDSKLRPKVVQQVEAGALHRGTEVQIKGYQHEYESGKNVGKPFVRAFVVNPVKGQRGQ
jgi:hypothetical protein